MSESERQAGLRGREALNAFAGGGSHAYVEGRDGPRPATLSKRLEGGQGPSRKRIAPRRSGLQDLSNDRATHARHQLTIQPEAEREGAQHSVDRQGRVNNASNREHSNRSLSPSTESARMPLKQQEDRDRNGDTPPTSSESGITGQEAPSKGARVPLVQAHLVQKEEAQQTHATTISQVRDGGKEDGQELAEKSRGQELTKKKRPEEGQYADDTRILTAIASDQQVTGGGQQREVPPELERVSRETDKGREGGFERGEGEAVDFGRGRA